MKPNVLLVVLDTVRARNVGIHGHANDTTPFIDEFAENSATHYEQARAPASRSLDSHVSLFTGLSVEEHGVVTSTDKLAPGNTIFDELSEKGYSTGVFSENSWLTDVDAGLKDSFETVEGPRNVPFPEELDPTSFVVENGQGQYGDFIRACIEEQNTTWKALLNGVAVKLGSDYPNLLPSNRTSTPAETYIDLFLNWADDQPGPWAACINLMDAHHPYEPKDQHDHWGSDYLWKLQEKIEDVKWEYNGGERPWWERNALEALYDGCIRQLDSQLQRLVNTLERREQLSDTMLVILSDHGEGFGEPSLVRPDTRIASHSVGSHEALLHVPLIVKYPNQTSGTTVSELATLTNFPRAVRAVLDGSWTHREFVSENPVIATVHGLDAPVKERALQYCDDLSAFTTTTRVAYQEGKHGIEKYVAWGDSTQTIIAPDAQNSFKLKDTDNGFVSDTFGHIKKVDIKQSGDGFDKLDEGTTQHLKDLGYT